MSNPYNTYNTQITVNNAAVVTTLGFRPVIVKVIDETNKVIWEKWDSMTSTTTIKMNANAGTNAVTTANDILLSDTGFTLSATVCNGTTLPATLSIYAVREEA